MGTGKFGYEETFSNKKRVKGCRVVERHADKRVLHI